MRVPSEAQFYKGGMLLKRVQDFLEVPKQTIRFAYIRMEWDVRKHHDMLATRVLRCK